MFTEQEERKYKLIILGDENTGKSSIIKRLIDNKYNSFYWPTLGMDFQTFKISEEDEFLDENQIIYYTIYDLSGQKKFNTLIPLYSNEIDIILLTYDITNIDSFHNIDNWIYLLNNINEEKVIIGLIGNKSDLEENRRVDKEEAQKYANEKNFFFQEVSALTGDGIKELFYNKLVEQIQKKFIQKEKYLNQIEEKFGINNDDDIIPISIENEDINNKKIRESNQMQGNEEKNKNGLCKCVDCFIF